MNMSYKEYYINYKEAIKFLKNVEKQLYTRDGSFGWAKAQRRKMDDQFKTISRIGKGIIDGNFNTKYYNTKYLYHKQEQMNDIIKDIYKEFEYLYKGKEK